MVPFLKTKLIYYSAIIDYFKQRFLTWYQLITRNCVKIGKVIVIAIICHCNRLSSSPPVQGRFACRSEALCCINISGCHLTLIFPGAVSVTSVSLPPQSVLARIETVLLFLIYKCNQVVPSCQKVFMFLPNIQGCSKKGRLGCVLEASSRNLADVFFGQPCSQKLKLGALSILDSKIIHLSSISCLALSDPIIRTETEMVSD